MSLIATSRTVREPPNSESAKWAEADIDWLAVTKAFAGASGENERGGQGRTDGSIQNDSGLPQGPGALPVHPESAVIWHSGFRGGAHARPEATPVHHACCGRGGVAACRARATASDAGDWVPQQQIA